MDILSYLLDSVCGSLKYIKHMVKLDETLNLNLSYSKGINNFFLQVMLYFSIPSVTQKAQNIVRTR